MELLFCVVYPGVGGSSGIVRRNLSSAALNDSRVGFCLTSFGNLFHNDGPMKKNYL